MVPINLPIAVRLAATIKILLMLFGVNESFIFEFVIRNS